jgi:hypothetical protein
VIETARDSHPIRTLVITGGHPFVPEPFFEVFDADPQLRWSHYAHPEAVEQLVRARPGDWDAIVFYDMPGVGLRRGETPRPEAPPERLVEALRRLLDAGQGVVFVHHAIASWPAWEEYAHWVGGRFLYQAGELRGKAWPDSGYAFDVTHRLTPVAVEHPVLEGIEGGFTITDECYLAPVFEDEVTPLLRSDSNFEDDRFYSAASAVAGRLNSREGWSHPRGSNLAAWATRARRSPAVYIQPGDGPSAYTNPGWRRLLGNATRWVASPEGHRWGAGQG